MLVYIMLKYYILFLVPVSVCSLQKGCAVNVTITASSLSMISDNCTTLTGLLHFDGFKQSMMKKLEQKFLSVIHIEGSILTSNNTFTSLAFLRNLQTVTGCGCCGSYASVEIEANKELKTLNLTSLVTVSAACVKSVYIRNQNSSLCITEQELGHFLEMDFAYFESIPICNPTRNYCRVNASTGYPDIRSTDDIPPGCEVLLGPISLYDENTADMKKLADLKEIYGAITIKNTDLTELTLNVERIYNQRAEYPPLSVVENENLTSISIPNLKSVNICFLPFNDMINIDNNPQLQLTAAQCTAWGEVKNVTSLNNKVNCGDVVISTPSSSALSSNVSCFLIFIYLFGYHLTVFHIL